MRWLVVVLAAGLIGCSGNKPSEVDNATVFPADYKDKILRSIPDVVDDPTNIKNAFVTEPFLAKSGVSSVYAVCVRGNPRDLSREYTGSKDFIAYFYAGTINQFVKAPPELCAKAAYKPFPELEKLCRSDKCA